MKRNGKIKILHVVLHLDYGGLEKIVFDVANGLSQNKFESSILCMDFYGFRVKELNKDVSVSCLGRNPGLTFKNFYLFYKLIKKIRPDIVHFRNFATYFWGCFVSRFQRDCRIVYSDHSDIILNYETKEKGKLFLRKMFKHITDNFMTNSLTFKEKLVEYVHIDPKNIVVIQNGVDTSKYYPMGLVEKRSLRNKFGFSDQAYIIGIVARLRPKKNLYLPIKAMSSLTSLIPFVELVLVGDGEQEDALKTLVQDLGLSKNVHFLGVTKEINKLLNIFDIFLFTSSSAEGMPNAVLEAMAARVPIVASDIPGNIEILQGGDRGVLFKNNVKDSLVECVLSLANDKELSNQIAEKAYQYVKNEMCLHRMVERYESFYSAVYKGQKQITKL